MSTILFICFVIFGCKPDVEDLKGHWHPVDEGHTYTTLDIDDSLVYINAKSLTGPYNPYSFYLYNLNDSLQLPVFIKNSFLELTTDFQLDNDTLIIGEQKIKYIKNNPIEYWEKDLFADLMIEINLKDCKGNSMSSDSLQQGYDLSFVNIGKPKQTSTLDTIQVNDVFIEPHELLLFIFQAKEVLHNPLKVGICLNIDKEASPTLLDSVYWYLNEIQASDYVFETCIDREAKEVKFQKSKRLQKERIKNL